MELMGLQETVQRILNKVRNLDRLLCDPKFVELWSLATESDRQRIINDVTNLNFENVKSWLKNHNSKPIDLMSLTELKRIGYLENIPRWSRLSKDELILEIKRARTTIKLDSRITLIDDAVGLQAASN
jgi:hypothetical protein